MKELGLIHVVSSLNVGGAERFVLDLGSKQLKQFNRVAILSFGSEQDQLVDIAKSIGIEVYTISRVGSVFGQIKLFSILRKFDVIHLHTAYALNPLSIVMNLIGSKVCVFTRHGAAPNNSSQWQDIHNKFKKFINGVAFVSQDAKNVFEETYPWKDIPMEVVDNGVIMPKAIDAPKFENKIRIGSVGRLVPLKHQISLLKAAELLDVENKTKISLEIFGDGEDWEKLTSFARDHVSDVDVTFHGLVTEREKIYNSIDILVMTSETEGLSLAIMEAMAYSNPVIATDVGGNSTLVNDGASGWLFDYDDSNALASIINGVVNDTQQIAKRGRIGRTFIEQNYSIDVTASAYERLYFN